MKLAQFDPPAYLDDFNSIPHQREAWNETLTYLFDQAALAEARDQRGKRQFYNPVTVDTAPDQRQQTITWNAFPRYLLVKLCNGDRSAALQAADNLAKDPRYPADAPAVRLQDEYCEWFVTRDPASHNILRVTFTCEGPEYWTALAEGYPQGYKGPRTAGADGDKQKLCDLYRQFISPDVQLEDLFVGNRYNPYNRWNTTDGAMHLIQFANSLTAEIQLAADASVLRAKGRRLLTDNNQLINCAKYGEPERFSDPAIGGGVNALARQGASITLLNPIGLYIVGVDDAGWTKPDGSPVDNYWQIQRGTAGMTVRAVYEVPQSAGFTVGDIKIGGEKINYGGQIAEHVTMKLTGVACQFNQSHNKPGRCVPSEAKPAPVVTPAEKGAETVAPPLLITSRRYQ